MGSELKYIGSITLKYDFRKMTERDVFKAKLGNEVVHFGHIPFWQRKKFIEFVTKHNFIEKIPGRHPTSYYVHHKFNYGRTVANVGGLPFGIFFEIYDDFRNAWHDSRYKNNYVRREWITVSYSDSSNKYNGTNYVQVYQTWDIRYIVQ